MPLADYAHHNEEALAIWYEEEGRHPVEPREPQDDDGFPDYYNDEFDDEEDDED